MKKRMRAIAGNFDVSDKSTALERRIVGPENR